jgi:hypothetical protein
LREHLQAVEKQTRHRPAELDVPPLPEEITYLWIWFLQLHRRRPYSQFGPGPITYSELLAWTTLRGIRLLQFEIDGIEALDAAFFEQQRKKVKGAG